MPGPAHETLVTLLAESPGLLNDLLVALGHRPLPPGLQRLDATVRAANPAEVRPDLLFGTAGTTGPWVVVEVQQGEDATKARRWLAVAALLHDTRGAMGDVVVITHEAAVERWALRVAHVEGPAGTTLSLRPRVVRVTRAEAHRLLAAGRPELAVVAAWAVHDWCAGCTNAATLDRWIVRAATADSLRDVWD